MDLVDKVINIGQRMQIKRMYAEQVEEINKQLRPLIEDAKEYGLEISEIEIKDTTNQTVN